MTQPMFYRSPIYPPLQYPPPQMQSPWELREVRPKMAAAMLGCSTGQVYSYLRDGLLESRSLLRRGYERGIRLISVASIRRLLEGQALPPEHKQPPRHSRNKGDRLTDSEKADSPRRLLEALPADNEQEKAPARRRNKRARETDSPAGA
jgi:hypothetical protein